MNPGAMDNAIADTRARRSIRHLGLEERSCGGAAAKVSLHDRAAGAVGPDLPFSPLPIAAVQLHQTGHSSITQHSGG